MKIFIILVLSITYGCATTQEPISYADIAKKYESMQQSYPPRIQREIEADCENEVCEIPEATLQALTRIITNLQDEIERRIDVSNQLLSAQGHCEYSNLSLRQSIGHLESAQSRTEITGQIKQLLFAGTCGILLWGK